MESTNLIQPIYGVEFRNRKGKNIISSIFYRNKKDAQLFVEKTNHKTTKAYICEYWLK